MKLYYLNFIFFTFHDEILEVENIRYLNNCLENKTHRTLYKYILIIAMAKKLNICLMKTNL